MITRTIVLAICSLILFGRCAQLVAPTGGKKDTIAPKLTQSIPANKTLNFTGNKVELFFDEYVIVDNINQKLVITPEVENPYTYKLNGESIVLNFKKKFQDSTTYTLNFGDGIKDFAEKNPAKNLKLVFSTGPNLDSGRVDGTVRDIRTNKPILDALVGLYHPSDTLNIARQKPYYFSRTDSSGRFSIENIEIKSYKLIAIDDKNRNMLYNPKEERVGFASDAVYAVKDSVNHQVAMYISDISPMKIQRTIPKVNNYTFVFNKGVERSKVTFITKDTLPYIQEATQLKFFNQQPHSDTIQVRLVVTDSLGTDSTFTQKIAFLAPRGKDRQKETFSIATKPEQGKPIAKAFNYNLTFNKPIARFDSSRIKLHIDSLHQTQLKDIQYSWNQFHNEITINAATSAKDSIKLELPKGSILSVEGDTLPAIMLKHALINEENFGLLTGLVINADTSMHTIVELLDEQLKIQQTSYGLKYKFEHIPQGNYFLRVILDLNNNKKWDTGRIDSNQQPEPIYFLPNKTLIKANFELNDINITIPK